MPKGKKSSGPRKSVSVDEQAMGTEPRLLKITSPTAMIESLNWYNYFMDSEKARGFVVKSYPAHADMLSTIPAIELRTLGWLCRMRQNGTDLGAFAARPDQMIQTFQKQYQKPIKSADNKSVNIQSRVARKNSRIIAEIEEHVDKHWCDPKYPFNAYQWMIANDVGNLGARAIAAYYEAWETKDKFIQEIINAANKLAANTKVIKRARKPKPVSALKQISKMQYKKSDHELALESVNPADIVGSSETWLYNVEKRMLTVLRGDALSVKGTTIGNFDPAKSFAKKLRKPEQDITKFTTTKAAMKKAFDGLSTKAANVTVGRTNNETIIMKVFK